MITPSQSMSSRPRGFTLLELLVVISIIGILAGMMYPCALAVMNHVKKTRTESTAIHLKNAINAYFTEYRKLPFNLGNQSEQTIRLASGPELMDVLCASPASAKESGLNPRRVVFFNGRNAKPLGNGGYHSGIRIDSKGSATLYDVWGELFEIALDGDNNGRIDTPDWDRNSTSSEITDAVLVWSKGPDKEDEGTRNDNVTSW